MGNFRNHRLTSCIYLLLLFPICNNAQNDAKQFSPVPFSVLFYNLDEHLLGSFTQNYGINHLAAAVGTYGIIKGKIDWNMYRIARDNNGVAHSGFPAVILGGLVPLVAPLYLYYQGKSKKSEKLQLVSLALTQASIISLTITSGYKAVTGRNPPDILDDPHHRMNYSDDFKFGFMNRGIFDGWPSGHTTTAFAMATTLIELYPENKKLKTWVLIYASLIGIGVSTNIHWFTDAFAGALIGYSIGKSVGAGFRELMDGKKAKPRFAIQITPGSISCSYRF